MIKRIALLAMAASLAVATALAQENAFDGNGGSGPFHLDPVLDGVLLGTAVGLDGTVFYLDEVAQVNQATFGGTVLDTSRVNSLDRLFMYPYSRELKYAGTGLSIASILMPAVLLAAPRDEWITIGTMYAETMLMAYGLKELGKVCVNRARPYLYFSGFPQDAVDEGDWNNAFPSGHTTLAFAGASFTSYVFSECFSDSGMKVPVVATSYALAVGTAAFRIASGDHFITDVIVGAIIGTACGVFVPWLHTVGSDSGDGDEGGLKMAVHPAPTGILVSFRF
jgi:undecaprenyl-diphosphatase